MKITGLRYGQQYKIQFALLWKSCCSASLDTTRTCSKLKYDAKAALLNLGRSALSRIAKLQYGEQTTSLLVTHWITNDWIANNDHSRGRYHPCTSSSLGITRRLKCPSTGCARSQDVIFAMHLSPLAPQANAQQTNRNAQSTDNS